MSLLMRSNRVSFDDFQNELMSSYDRHLIAQKSHIDIHHSFQANFGPKNGVSYSSSGRRDSSSGRGWNVHDFQ